MIEVRWEGEMEFTEMGLICVILSLIFGPRTRGVPLAPPGDFSVAENGKGGREETTVFEFHLSKDTFAVIFEHFACVDDLEK